MKKSAMILAVAGTILAVSGAAWAMPVEGTYTPGPGPGTTWQTYWDDGTTYGDGPIEVGNVIMGWQTFLPGSLWDLCPGTQVWSPNPATDLILAIVTPEPPGTGIVQYGVIYFGGELLLDGALWGGSGTYMVNLSVAVADVEIDWTGGVPESGCDENGASCAMDLVAVGTFVDYPGYSVTFSANFTSDYICSGGFSGTPSDVEITIIPEPATMILLCGGAAPVLLRHRRKRRT